MNQQPFQAILTEQYGAARCPDDPGTIFTECGDSVRLTFLGFFGDEKDEHETMKFSSGPVSVLLRPHELEGSRSGGAGYLELLHYGEGRCHQTM